MFDGNPTHTSKGRVVQSVNLPNIRYGTKKLDLREHIIKTSHLYKMIRVGNVHKIVLGTNNILQVSGCHQYCMDWWDNNVSVKE